MNVRLGELKIKESFSLGELKLANVTVNGGGYERGYEAGYEKGETDGYSKGEADGYERGEAESYPKGYADGYAKGEAEGIEVGRNAEWSDRWDNIQDYGNRTDYRGYNGFGGKGWNDKTFKPKHKIQPTDISNMFYGSNIENAAYTDLLDFSKATGAEQAFRDSNIAKLKVVDFRNLVCVGYSIYMTFMYSVKYIEEFYPPVKGEKDLTQLFYYAGDVFTHIKFCSEIIKGGVRLINVNLDKESIDSVMYWLSTTTEGLSVTLPLAAVKREYETYKGANDGDTSPEWENKVAARPNWTIRYA